MTKSELIETLAEQHAHVPVKDVENAVKEILEQMAGSLSTSDRIEIRGFGSSLCITALLAQVVILRLAIQ